MKQAPERTFFFFSFSSTDTNLPRSCDAFHPDQETGSPYAHPTGADGSAGWGASWEPLSGTAAGSTQVLAGFVGNHRQKKKLRVGSFRAERDCCIHC